ncbi:hypothetical protein HDZ31DRAFT_38399, partial [Schizophyllum fasciatum]
AQRVANIPLHRTFFIPNINEAAAIKEQAEKLRVIVFRIRALEYEVAKPYPEPLRRIFEQQGAILAQLAIHDSLLSPCRRLPPEILSSIFLLAVPATWGGAYVGKRCLNFACVCLTWRAVAFGTPALWTGLRLRANVNLLYLKENPAALEAELERTAQAPLDIRIEMGIDAMAYLPFPRPSVDEIWSDAVWKLLYAQSHRWSRIWFDKIPLPAYTPLVNLAFPSLLDMTIYMEENNPQPAVQPPVHAFHNAPNVTTVLFDYKSSILPLEFPQTWKVTDLTIVCVDQISATPGPCLEATLGCCSSLRSLCIAVDESWDGVQMPPAPLMFPQLDTLYLGNNAIFLCSLITTPKLKELTISGYPDHNPFGMLQDMLTRSSGCPDLRLFSLTGLDTSDADISSIIVCLGRLPQLTELELANDEELDNIETPLVTRRMVQALNRDGPEPGASVLLPNLSSLAIDLGGLRDEVPLEDPFFLGILQDSLRSRQHPRELGDLKLQPLASFSYGGDPAWPYENFVAVCQNIQSGVEGSDDEMS